MDITFEGIDDLYRTLYWKMVKSKIYRFDIEYLVKQFLMEYPGFESDKNILDMLTKVIKLTDEKSNNYDISKIVILDYLIINKNPIHENEIQYKVKTSNTPLMQASHNF